MILHMEEFVAWFSEVKMFKSNTFYGSMNYQMDSQLYLTGINYLVSTSIFWSILLMKNLTTIILLTMIFYLKLC